MTDEFSDESSRRTDPRISLNADGLTVSVQGEPAAVARNLSAGGVFVVTEKRWNLGTVVTLHVGYRGVRVAIKGRLTHHRGDGVGFAFFQPEEELIRAIRNIISDLLTGGAESNDRRGGSRKLVNGAIIWTQGGKRAEAKIRDLSKTGAYVASTDNPALGTELMVYMPGFMYSGGEAIPSEARGCSCKVMRADDGGFGVQFIGPSAEFLMAVQSLVEVVRK
jgi:Tfp pilus assembly protein PilZ